MTGQLWQVIGDEITVRQGKARSSPELIEALPSGVIVEEQELVGERLHFINLSKAGPRSGWVNTKQKCKDVLIPISPDQVPAKEELQSSIESDHPLGGWAKLSEIYKNLQPDEPQGVAAAAAAETVGTRRRRVLQAELPPIDELEGANPELLCQALGFTEDAAKHFTTLTITQKRKIIAEAKALINMNNDQRQAALDKVRKAWPTGPMPTFSSNLSNDSELLPKDSCFPVSRYLRDGSGVDAGMSPEWGLESSAAKAVQKAFFARKQTTSSLAQKEYFRSLKCEVVCTIDEVQPESDAKLVDSCRMQGYADKDLISTTIMTKGSVRPDEMTKYLNGELKRKILFMDGGIGARIQAENLGEAEFRGDRFKSFKENDAFGKPVSLKGNNDLLCLTRPNLIFEIHKEYLLAGSDICRTNTHKSNAITQGEYKMAKIVYELNKSAAQIAKKASADVTKQDPNKPRFVAGVIGPTYDRTWDVLVEAYDEQIRGLVDGGVDLLMIDAVCDTLSAKAAIYAFDEYFIKQRKKPLPLIISVSIGENGRTYSGATIEAFFISIKHAKPIAVGINTPLGAEKAKTFYKSLASLCSCWCQVCPGAESGDPDSLVAGMLEYGKEKLLNIVGGDSTALPSHIAAMIEKLKNSNVRDLPAVKKNPSLQLSGLEACVVAADEGFSVVGQRCTSMGSAKFKRLVNTNNFKEAVEMCVSQCEKGADILDINLDTDSTDNKPMPGTKTISKFVRMCAAEPKVAKVPLMICSSDWKAIEEGLKCAPGKCIVNGICLMLGEEEFVRIARECMRYGAAVVVLAISEKGVAESYEDKVRVCQRSYRLLRSKLDFPAEDIICDCQVPMIGLSELPLQAMNFVHAAAEVKRTCPGVSIIGGLGNLSLPFRGLSMLRDALHAVFLYHAIPKGLNLAMAEPGALPRYTDLDAETRALCEEIILNRSADDNHMKRFLAFVGFRSNSLVCMPVTTSPSHAPELEAKDAADNLQNIHQKRKPSSAADQKTFLRSLSCDVRCNASPTPANARVGRPEACRIEGAVQKDEIAGTIKAKGTLRPDDMVKYLNGELRRRIFIMDDDLTAKIEASKLTEADYRGDRFKGASVPQKGNNLLLSITKPDLIANIHKEGFNAGADICCTNTLDGNAISQKGYKTEAAVYELNKMAAQLAKRCAAEATSQDDNKPRFVAGVMGPTDCHLSTSSDVAWDELVDAYGEQIKGLVDGGVDILSIVFADTLNAKAVIYAVDEYFEQAKKERLPLIITAIIDEKSGRTLSGQAIEAALISLRHAKPLSMGINCSAGMAQMKKLYDTMLDSSITWCQLSAKAGSETPDALANQILDYANDKKLNFVSVKSTHISAVASKLKGLPPRKLPSLQKNPPMQLSSLEAHTIGSDDGLHMVGQRCNVMGCSKFKGFVNAYKYTAKENKWDAVVEFCAKQCDKHADIMDFNFDSNTIDGKVAMGKVMNLCGAEPKVAKVPFIISSMKWPVIEEGLKSVQGKCIVNAISLLQGEEEFIRVAKECQRHGAAIVVMAIDKPGEFAAFPDKVRICQRSYELLRSRLDFPAQDIIFDCNVAPVGESAVNAKDFLDAIAEVKRTCPSVSFIAGVSNLSLPFRGVNMIREALHSVFLYHAVPKGLNLAIVDSGSLPRYNDLEAPTKTLCEEVILNGADMDSDHMRRLIDFVGFMDRPRMEEEPAAESVPEESLPLVVPEAPRKLPKFRKPLVDLVQATGTVNASIFQSFGSKSHAAKNFHRMQYVSKCFRNVMFSSISVYMGQGGAGPTPASSSIMDNLALWERQQGMMNMSVTLLWGAVGEIGLRLAIYGSRDVFAQFDLGQKLIGPADTQFMEKQIITGSDVQEHISLAYLDQTWQGTLKGSGGGGLEGRKTFADM